MTKRLAAQRCLHVTRGNPTRRRDRHRGGYERTSPCRTPIQHQQRNDPTSVRPSRSATSQTSPARPGTRQPTTPHPPTRPHTRHATDQQLNIMINLSYAALVLGTAAVALTAFGNVPTDRAAMLIEILLGQRVSAGFVDRANARLAGQLERG